MGGMGLLLIFAAPVVLALAILGYIRSLNRPRR
jgi:hypothetical protein